MQINGIQNRKAFTLAEILVTLSIIGVIASMTIPSLVQDIQDAQLKTAWKKAIANATQSYMMAISKNAGKFPSYNCYNGSGMQKYNALKENMQIIKSCSGNTLGNCWASSGVGPDSVIETGCPLFKKNNHNASYAFVSADGMYWMIYSVGTVVCPIMAVDVNGAKGPNTWGKDVLTFEMTETRISPGHCGANSESNEFLYK